MHTFSVISISGTVKWVGVLHDDAIAPELYVGVRLDDNGIVTFCAQFAQIIRLWFDFPVNNFSVMLGCSHYSSSLLKDTILLGPPVLVEPRT